MVGIRQRWLSVRLPSLASRSELPALPCVGLHCKNHFFFFLLCQKETFPAAWVKPSEAGLHVLFFFEPNYFLGSGRPANFLISPRSAKPMSILSQLPLVPSKRESLKDRNTGCLSDSAFCSLHQALCGTWPPRA